jgi:hypothetical protein
MRASTFAEGRERITSTRTAKCADRALDVGVLQAAWQMLRRATTRLSFACELGDWKRRGTCRICNCPYPTRGMAQTGIERSRSRSGSGRQCKMSEPVVGVHGEACLERSRDYCEKSQRPRALYRDELPACWAHASNLGGRWGPPLSAARLMTPTAMIAVGVFVSSNCHRPASLALRNHLEQKRVFLRPELALAGGDQFAEENER